MNAAKQATSAALDTQRLFTTGLEAQIRDLRTLGGAEMDRLWSLLQGVDEAVDGTQV